MAADDASLTIGTARGNDLVLTDETVSRYHLELSATPTGISAVDLGSTNGTRFGPVSIESAVVEPGITMRLGQTQVLIERDRDRIQTIWGSEELHGLWGRSPAMRSLMERAARVAESDVTVLIGGETGCGKEVVARAIHAASRRKDGPFEIVDCGAVAPTLIASELFGHEKGAFTGADRRQEGAFERAGGGTIFLDELGELPAQLQSWLLGVLERRRFRRLGGTSQIEVDVRVLAATNRDLRALVNDGRFREDLYYRLAACRIDIPPLRERPEDVPLLIAHFLKTAGHDEPVDVLFPPPVMEHLVQHRWPGNARELRNFVEVSIALGETDVPSDGTDSLEANGTGLGQITVGDLLDEDFKKARASTIERFERTYVQNLIDRCEGNVSRAARESGIHRSYLNLMLKRHGLR